MRIAAAHLEEIVAHAREDLPNECCGLVGGKGDEVTSVHRTRNAFEYVHCRISGECEEKDDEKRTPRRKRKYRPSRDAAVPGAQGGQRLGIGARFGR